MRANQIGLFVVLATTSTLGCGQATSTVSGTVRFQGRPLSGGSVILYCDDQQMVRGLIGPGGRYSIPNVPRGAARVTVKAQTHLPEAFRVAGNLPPVEDGPQAPTPSPRSDRTPNIPHRYGLPEESGLAVTVAQATVEHDIDLHP